MKTKEQVEAEKSACYPDPCTPPEIKKYTQGRPKELELKCPDSPEEIEKRERLKRESEEFCCALKNPHLVAAAAAAAAQESKKKKKK